MIKRIKAILGIFVAMTIVTTISGCSKGNKTKSDILTDLENAGFKTTVTKTFDALSEITNNNGYDMTCSITNNAEFETTDIYECNVVCSNSDFEISYDLKVTYIKNGGWNFSTYEIINTDSKMNGQIPEERIIGDIQQHFAQDNLSVELDESTISQKINEGSIGCEASANGTISEGILSKECCIKARYVFNDEWNVFVESSISSYDWDVQALAGKKWLDTYKWSEGDFIYIESVDEANSTMMVGYRKGIYSSTIDGPYEQHGKPIKCSYTLDEECIKIKTGDFTLEIYPDMHTIMSGYKTYPSN